MSENVLTHPRIYYDRSTDVWTEEEQEQITKKYNDDQMNIIQIGNLHKRTPGCISSQLQKIGVISNRIDVRGYPEYKISALYQEIISMPRQRERKTKTEQSSDANISEQTTANPRKLTKSDKMILELQEIKELLKTIVTKL
jgi:hypothetical protein